uniref:Cytochrome P450 CYP4BD5v1 n=1 Tax=Dendroctonus rhizophagus TaxID=77169 RepID=G3CLJ7_9CUCU|nr:cytochrome P450 CYP4BD5v1 [Dendroctonus rhizophagus]
MWILLLLPVVAYILIQIAISQVKSQKKYLRNVPGKKPFLIFGNMLDFMPGSTVLLDNLMGYLKTYGDTILVHDGSFSWVLLTIDYEFNEFLHTSTVHIEKSNLYNFFKGWLGQGLLTSFGPTWRSHRKVITPSFHFSILQQFISVFDSVGNKLMKKLESEAGKDSVEVSQLISLYALDVICEAAMGVKIHALESGNSEYVKSIKEMCNIVVDRMFSIISTRFYKLTSTYQKEKKALKIIHEHVDAVISKRLEEYSQKPEKSSQSDDFGVKKRLAFLDMLLEARIDGKPLTKTELRDEVNTFMFEGHDTTSSAMSFALYLIATHPEVQDKLFEEQTQIFPSDCKNARPSHNELLEMKYLDLVIKETLRLFPPVTFYGRKLAHDVEFKGTLYPKGLSVLLFPYGSHRSPKYFTEPDKFIPERFENWTGKLPFAYTPFSAGPRNCIGQKFAVLEMLATLSKIRPQVQAGASKARAQTRTGSRNDFNFQKRSEHFVGKAIIYSVKCNE